MRRQEEMCESITCESAARLLPEHMDGRLRQPSRLQLEEHLFQCAACSSRLRDLRTVQSAVRSLPVRVAPPDLHTRLRVLGSRESLRRRQRLSPAAAYANWKTDFQLSMQNLMRPLAIPTAGGFASAVLLFGSLILFLSVPSVSANNRDVPTGLFTQASVKSVIPLGFHEDDLIVEITIDEQGRMVDYSIPNNKRLENSPAFRRSIENSLLFTQFTPATTFGQPMSAKIRISFRSSRIEVKG